MHLINFIPLFLLGLNANCDKGFDHAVLIAVADFKEMMEIKIFSSDTEIKDVAQDMIDTVSTLLLQEIDLLEELYSYGFHCVPPNKLGSNVKATVKHLKTVASESMSMCRHAIEKNENLKNIAFEILEEMLDKVYTSLLNCQRLDEETKDRCYRDIQEHKFEQTKNLTLDAFIQKQRMDDTFWNDAKTFYSCFTDAALAFNDEMWDLFKH